MILAGNLSRPALRRTLRQARRNLSPLQQRLAAKALYRQLAHHPLFRRAQRIGLYLPNDGEIDPRPLMHAAWQRGKQIYLPVLQPWPATRMTFQPYKPGQRLQKNRFGIAEPAYHRTRHRPAWVLDLLLLPLVGFDPQGGRLGMGGGFYDRSLSYRQRRRQWKSPALVGLAHECQKVDQLTMANWDVPLTACVTELRWYSTRPALSN